MLNDIPFLTNFVKEAMYWRFALFVVFLYSSCSTDRSIDAASEEDLLTLEQFLSLDNGSMVKIGSEDEPGEILKLCISLINKNDGKPVSGQSIYFYQTDVNGNYQMAIPGNESSARLNGEGVTNASGEIYVETMLPGDYGSSEDNRHIHTTVKGAAPEAYDIHFKQYASFMLIRFVQGSDQHFLADLKRLPDGSLFAELIIWAKYR